MKTFSAQIKGWTDKAKANMRSVVEDSVQDVLEGAQTTAKGMTAGGVLIEGRIPVVSADLVNSLVSQVNGTQVAQGASSYAVAVAGFELGDTMRFAWTMEYANRVEHGFRGTDAAGRTYNQSGWHFVGFNAAKWPEHVRRNAGNVK